MKTFVCVTDTRDKPVVVFLNSIVKITEGPTGSDGKKTSDIHFVDSTWLGIKMPISDLLVVMNGQ